MVKPFFRIIMAQEGFPDGSSFVNMVSFSDSVFTNITSQSSSVFESYIIKVKNNPEKIFQIAFKNCIFTENTGTNQGAIFQDTSEYDLSYGISFRNSRFVKNYGANGLMVLSKTVNSLLFDQCTFDQNLGLTAKVLKLSGSAAVEVNITNSIFSMAEFDINYMRGVMLAKADNENEYFNQPTQLYLSGFTGTFYAANIAGTYLAYSGFGAFLALDGASQKVYIDNANFYSCASWYGGVLSVQAGSKLYLTNSVFQLNSAAMAGAFLLNSVGYMKAENLTFLYNYAVQSGVFRVSGGSSLILKNALVSNNMASYEDSIGIIIEAKDSSIFTNVTFKQNKMLTTLEDSEDKGFEITACAVLVGFYSCKFIDNQARSTTPNIYMNKALNVVIDDCTFKNEDPLDNAPYSIKGGFIHMIGGSKVTVTATQFTKGEASQGGAIFMLGDTSLTLSNCAFEDNFAFNKGGAIAAITFDKIDINTGTYFTNNRAKQQVGDVIYALNTEGTIIVNSTNFYNDISQNFMFLQDISNLIVVDTIFEASSFVQKRMNLSSLMLDSALVFTNVLNLTMDKCVFQNLVSNQPTYGAGAIYITQSAINKRDQNKLRIGRTRFENCLGINGGALAIVDVMGFFIGNGTSFSSNQASQQGGAIYFNCLNHGSQLNLCSLTFENGVSFSKNSAGEQGGAVKWNYYEPANILTQSTFTENSAILYGNDIASIPQRLVKKSSNSNQRILSESGYTSGSISNVSSGGVINMAFELQDKYGNVVTTDQQSKLFISSVVTKGAQGFTSSIESTTQIGCENGTFTVSDFKFVGQPNSTRSIKIRTDGIDYGIPSNEEYRQERLRAANAALGDKKYVEASMQAAYEQELTEMSESVFVDLNLRSCLPGEELLSSGKCQTCDYGKYLLVSPDIYTPTTCKECPSSEKAECEGGNAIYPKAGYWRSSIYSDNFLECRNDVACLGRNGAENNLLGACNVGYQGTLCLDCQLGFSRSGSSYKCAACPEREDNSVRVIFLFFAMIIAIVFLVRSSLAGALEKKNLLSVFIRILMNHFQLLTLTASFDLDWPDQLKSFFQATKPVSEVSTQFLSFDCFIDTRNGDGEETIRVFYSKMAMMAALPFLIMGASFVVWNALFLFKKNPKPQTIHMRPEQANFSPKNSLKELSDTHYSYEHHDSTVNYSHLASERDEQKSGRIISTIIIVLFLVHPTITTIMFNAFNCQDIDGKSLLYEDLEIECNVGQHRLYSLSIALPSIIIWGLGIPSLAMLLLYQRRKDLTLTETKAKFGFLYNGYRIPQAYYWELIIMYRKIVVIFIQVFLAQLGKIVQALTMLLFLIVCLTITAAKQPFANHYLNSLEALSLLSSAVTVYCGLFYIAKASFKKESSFEMSNEAELFLFITIVVTHIGFLGYWGYHFLGEIRSMIRKKAPKLYIALFLCCRKEALDSELQIEDARERMGPMLQTIDKLQDYLQERRMMYIKGQVPWEDDAFKKMIAMCKGYVERVDKMMAFSIGEGRDKGLSVAELMQDKQRGESISKLRPKHQKSLKRKMLGAERLVMALDMDLSSQPRLKQIDENESSIGFDDDNDSPKNKRVLLQFESRNHLEECKETFGVEQDEEEDGVMDYNGYTLNQLSQEIETSNMTLITKGPHDDKKFLNKRYSQGNLDLSPQKGFLGTPPELQSPTFQIGGQAYMHSARIMKEVPDFYHTEIAEEPSAIHTQHFPRGSMEDSITILQRSTSKNINKNKSKGSVASQTSGKIKDSRFKLAKKDLVKSSMIDLQGISEEEDKQPPQQLNDTQENTQIQHSSRENIIIREEAAVVNNLLMEEEDIEEEMHRALQNI